MHLWPLLLMLLAEPKPIAMHLNTHAAFEPVTLRIELRIPKHAENRYVVVSADSGVFYRQSAFVLDGDLSPTLFPVEWRDVPAGEYTVAATLFDAMSQARGRVSETVQILPRN